MTGGAVAVATAAVFVAGRQVGSAVLVADRLLLTAGHVLRRGVAYAEEVQIVFPAGSLAADAALVTARPVEPDPAADVPDAAVLQVTGPLPPRWPRPVPLWPARRLPERVSVLGFPQQERALRGVWRDFAVSGPAAGGAVQLDWTGVAGTLPGHSGGPVVDPGSGAVVGVLVEGSEVGRFDRFTPTSLIVRCWPALPRPWLMAGVDARSHFERRSRGQRSRARGGNLFRGRHTALAAVRAWLTATQPPGRPLVITGQPGAGKSSVLARAVLDLEAGRHGGGVAFHAQGARHGDLLTAVADLTGVDRADGRDALIDALADADEEEGGPILIAVDALDEAATAADRRQIAESLAELAVLPAVRVVVATRPLAAAGAWYAPGGLLRTLGVTGEDSPYLVNLDTDRYFEPAGLQDFAAAVLTQHGATRPGPPGSAWTAYRADGGLRDRLAGVIAARAGRNYLVAAMAAVPLSVRDDPVDPATPGFDTARIPAEVGEALAKYLDTLRDPQRALTRGLLTALAYARGPGIDDRTWLAFAQALGYPAATADLDQLRRGAAADYLLQTVIADTGPVTRLFHQALTDELLTDRHPPADERALLSILRPDPSGGWATASRYARTHAAEHADMAGQLPHLLQDCGYLVHADLSRLLPLLPLRPDRPLQPVTAVLRRCGARATPLPPGRRARLLALTAAHLGLTGLQQRYTAAGYRAVHTPLGALPGRRPPGTHRPHQLGGSGGDRPGRGA